MEYQDKKKITAMIHAKIRREEDCGETAGGSGHCASTDYVLDEVGAREMYEGKIRIPYSYHLEIITEFTCFPDNPPHRIDKSAYLFLDSDDDKLRKE